MGKAHYTELPPGERAAYYRQMARETEALGENGSTEFRKNCREFAARWRKLANELMTSSFEEGDTGEQKRSRPSDIRDSSPPQDQN